MLEEITGSRRDFTYSCVQAFLFSVMLHACVNGRNRFLLAFSLRTSFLTYLLSYLLAYSLTHSLAF